MAEAFSAAWAAAWREEINRSRGYRRAGARWDDTVAFVMRPDPFPGGNEERAVLLDLSLGECRDARVAGGADLAAASFVIVAEPDTWKRIFSGRLDIVFAIMQKRFTLRRGTFAELMPHSSAANELLAAARKLDTRFPDA
jgi:putative sterol carrier protein